VHPGTPKHVSQGYRLGLTDESGKINRNLLQQLAGTRGNTAYNMLMMFPNMTDDIANSMLDWLDADQTPRSNGAEDETYSGGMPSYRARNGPIDSIDELLLVKGVTLQMLFGNDKNRNGKLDDGEDDGTGVFDPGWAGYLTINSREQNLDSQGNPRIWINDTDLNNLYNSLSEAVGQDLANYIIAY